MQLRAAHPALQRNEVDFIYSHPEIDCNDSVRVFAYCRTAGRPLGSAGQVAVCADCGPRDFTEFRFPWPWAAQMLLEVAAPPSGSAPRIYGPGQTLTFSLSPFQIRVLRT